MMQTEFKTEQEQFWAGAFGDEYIDRNKSEHLISGNIALFAKILACTENVRSVFEFGANIGLNLIAIKHLLPNVALSAVEINKQAVVELKKVVKEAVVYQQSILDFSWDVPPPQDLVLIKGVLIHINPDILSQVYQTLYRLSKRYICIAEYYNPTPVSVPYRGHRDRLFKRDFAGEMMNKYQDLRLVNYGFVYHRDPNFPLDDLTWFLLEKTV